MTENALKNCTVMLQPCTPKMKECYVSLQRYPTASIGNRDIHKPGMSGAISTPKPSAGELLCTPNVEPALATELRRAITEKNILTTKTKSKFIAALNELEVDNAETSRKQKKEKAMKEVIDSEVAYLRQLETIIKYFKEPLNGKYILSEEEIEKVFSKVTMLYNLNKELLNRMSENPINIAEAFKNIAPYFKMYSTYAYEYRMVTEFLQVLQNKNEDFSTFLKCQETRPEVRTKLSSLLITPIQRIPRYCLLLKQILLYTLEMEADHKVLKECLKLVEESAKHINSLVEERENSERLLSIQNSLMNYNPQIIKPGRKLIKEGKVLKMTETGGNIMYLVAMTDILMFCKIKRENVHLKNALKCSAILPLNKCQLSQNANLRKIQILCENEDINIYIETAKEFHHWTDVLKESHKNIIYNRYTLRKESSARRPAYKENLCNYNEIGVSPGIPQKKRRTPIPSAVFTKTSTETTKNKRKKLGYITPSKRRCIRDKHEENIEEEVNDSLYPLRHFCLPNSNSQDVNYNPNTLNGNEQNAENVFVFGQPDSPNGGFNFRVTSFFSYLGNSLKRFFRIK